MSRIFCTFASEKQIKMMAEYRLEISGVHYGANGDSVFSTRYDSSFFQFNGFISVGQISAAVCVLAVLVVYSVRSVRANGRRGWHWAIWGGWFIGLVAAGLSEYFVQRHGNWYLGCYAVMALGCVIMTLTPWAAYLSVCKKKSRKRSRAA